MGAEGGWGGPARSSQHRAVLSGTPRSVNEPGTLAKKDRVNGGQEEKGTTESLRGCFKSLIISVWNCEYRDGVSREVPCSALKGETVPDSLPATPKPLSSHL